MTPKIATTLATTPPPAERRQDRPSQPPHPAYWGPDRIAVGDINGDGQPDVVGVDAN